ncbi:MAG: ABC transporter permease [Acidobacteriia bacterium]|nr:ABC transporter permease [Terriglobia bacterium]
MKTNSFFEDIRYTLRTLRLNPGFATVAVLSLTLGIGANTAIFSLVDAIMLRMLPVTDPERLVFLSDPASAGVASGAETGVRSLFTYQEFEHLRDHNQVFSGAFASESNPARINVRIAMGPVEEARGKLVSGAYFEVLGVRPALGRTFTAAEDSSPGADPVAVLSYDYWTRRFGSDRAILGTTIELNRNSFTIIGVAPPGFNGEIVGESPALYLPMMMEPQLKPGRFWLRDDPKRAEKVMWLHIGGRLKPGIKPAQAQANIDVVFRQYLENQAGSVADPQRRREIADQKILVHSGATGASTLRAQFTQPLLVLMAIVGLVLLIACANVANLLLARATARQKEIGVRIALGASRGRLIRQLLTESTVLSGIGGTAGVLFAYWAARLLVRLASPPSNPIPLEVDPHARVLAFTVAVSVLTGVLFGLVPALRATRMDVNSTLKENARSVAGSGARLNTGKVLVIGQVAISLLLVLGAGLFVRTLRNLQTTELGYSRDSLLLVRIDGLSAGYDSTARAGLYQRVLEDLKTLPGVRGVTLSENGLFSGTESGDQVTVEGFRSDKEGDNASNFDQVGPNYFSTLGIPILVGREIGPQDTATSNQVCVVNEAFARFYFGRGNPIGKHVRDEFPDTRVTFEIVGVTRDARDHRLRGNIPRRFYVPFFHPLGEIPPAVNYEIRTFADADSMLSVVRRKIQEIDGAVPILSARSLSELLDRTVIRERMIAQVSSFFGLLALLLASIGLYGVLAYSIERRTHEIGIRMALGAQQGRILGGVLRETMLLVVLGISLGVPAALACGRFVESSLVGLAVLDPVTLSISVLVIAVVAMLAGYLPARRAARVDPLIALRCE